MKAGVARIYNWREREKKQCLNPFPSDWADWRRRLLKPRKENCCLLGTLKFPHIFMDLTKSFINWFAWSPRSSSSRVSINYFFFSVGVCEAFSPNGLRWRRAAHQLALTWQPTPRAHASSSDQWGLSRSEIKGSGSSTKSRPAVTVFVFSRDPARQEVKHSLSARARGRWCSWGSLINSSRAFY